MKKKWFVGLGVVVLSLGITTAAFATQPQVSNGQSHEINQNSELDARESLYKWDSLIMGTQTGLIR